MSTQHSERAHRPRRALPVLVALVLGVAGAVAMPTAASAADIAVTNTNDSGAGSLRDAIATAGPADVVVFDPTVFGEAHGSKTISLLSTITIDETTTIEGPGADWLTVDRGVATAFNQFEVDGAAAIDVNFSGFVIGGGGLGSAFYATSGDLNDATFTNMYIGDQVGDAVNLNRGAGLHIQNMDGDLTIYESVLANNNDDLAAAAYIYHVGGDVLVQSSILIGNVSTLVGGTGAMFIGDAQNVTFSDGTGAGLNTTQGDGGVASIQFTRGDVLITESNFGDNTAASDGGAFHLVDNDGATDVRNSSFIGNDAVEQGGAIYADNTGAFTIESSRFESNTAAFGGGVLIETINGSSAVYMSEFVSNSATTGNGGGLVIDNVQSDFGITFSTFSGNTAAGTNGAGVYFSQVDDLIGVFSSTFTGNSFTGAPGSGISIGIGELDAEGYVINSTLDESSDTSRNLIDIEDVNGAALGLSLSTFIGPGVLNLDSNGGFVTLNHSIVDSKGLPAVTVVGDPVEAEWSLFSGPLEASVTNIEGNRFSTSALLGPLQNNGGVTQTRLPGAGSPAVNMGDPTLVSYPDFDQRGEGFPRVLEGRIDIGAVEVPFVLPPTGQSVNLWVPIGGGVLLLLGIAAVVLTRLRGQGSRSAR